MTIESCGTCRFHSSHRDGFNLCQRHAPVVDSTLIDSAQGLWPETAVSDWCGDWEQAWIVVEENVDGN